MIKGTHNSMSYLNDKRWYMRPFQIWSKCQSKDILQQWNDNVRYFDFRIRFEGHKPYFAHGLSSYSISVGNTIRDIAVRAEQEKSHCYIRIILENTISKENDVNKFKTFTDTILKYYNFNYVSFRFGIKYPWEIFYDDFDVPFVEIAKHFDKKYHAIIPIKYWLWEQNRIKEVLNQTNFNGIVAEDFV